MATRRDSRPGNIPGPPSVLPQEARSRFRTRDSLGALRPRQAELDAAYARGYAEGQEEALLDAIDRFQTVLVEMMESKFGELAPELMDTIAAADLKHLQSWVSRVASSSDPAALLAQS